MAAATTEPRIGRVDEDAEAEAEAEEQHGGRLVGCEADHGVVAREVGRRVSRLAVEGGGGGGGKAGRGQGVRKIAGAGGAGSVVGSGKVAEDDADVVYGRRSAGGGRTLPPPHAWLAIEDARKHYDSDPEAENWARLLRGGGGGGGGGGGQRRSSFSVVRRERAAREAWLDRAWEMKRSWHERNGGAPDADTPVVVVVGKGPASSESSASHAGAVGGGGVAMDVEEVRACRDLGLELPHDCTVEIQCYGLSGGSSPTHPASSGAASPCAGAGACFISSPGADPMDVKARLKVWAQAVALASTTHLSS
ncbi:hypothetical protein ACP70R_041237 [Stipagrostis hirtigluma subsp. patula]